IRDFHVTGVQTCALPISGGQLFLWVLEKASWRRSLRPHTSPRQFPRRGKIQVRVTLNPIQHRDASHGSDQRTAAGGAVGEVSERSEERRVGKECRSRGVQ